MTPSVVIRRRTPRSGITVMWVLVILSVLAVTSASAAWQFTTGRRTLERRQNRIQALWLARSGGELAAARLLAEPDGYTGETITPIAESKVRITVEKDAARANSYKIRCDARYPEDGPGAVNVAVSWIAMQRKDPPAVRLEVVDEQAAGAQPGP